MKEKQREEAVIRLKQLESIYGLGSNVVEDFELYGLIHCAAITTVYEDKVDWVDEQLKMLRRDKGILPYYIMLDPIYINILYVGSYEEDWLKERPDYEKNIIFAYVINTQQPEFSEFGSIMIEGIDNAVLRVG